MGMEKNTVSGSQVMKKVAEIRSQYKNNTGAFPHEHGMAWMMDPYTWYALINGSYDQAIDADSKQLYQMDVFRSAEVPKGMVFLVLSSAHPYLKKSGGSGVTLSGVPTGGTFTFSAGGNTVTFPHTVSAAQVNTTLKKVSPNQPMPAGKEGQFLIKDNKQYVFSGSQWLEMTTATPPKIDEHQHPVYPHSPVSGLKSGDGYYYWVGKPKYPGAFFPHPFADSKKAMEFAKAKGTSVVKLPVGEHPYKVVGEELPKITPEDLYSSLKAQGGDYPKCYPGSSPEHASPEGFSYWAKKPDGTYYPAPYGDILKAVSFAKAVATTVDGGDVTVVKVLAGVSPYEHPHEKVWPAEPALEKAKMWEEWKAIYPADGAKTKYALESSDESAVKYLDKVLGWNKGLKGEKVKAFKDKWFPEEPVLKSVEHKQGDIEKLTHPNGLVSIYKWFPHSQHWALDGTTGIKAVQKALDLPEFLTPDEMVAKLEAQPPTEPYLHPVEGHIVWPFTLPGQVNGGKKGLKQKLSFKGSTGITEEATYEYNPSYQCFKLVSVTNNFGTLDQLKDKLSKHADFSKYEPPGVYLTSTPGPQLKVTDDWTPTIEQMEKLAKEGKIKSLSVDYYKKQDAKWWKEQFTAVAAQPETYSSDKGWGLLYEEMKAKTGIDLDPTWGVKNPFDVSKWTVGEGSSKSFHDMYKTAEKLAGDSANYTYGGVGSMGVYQQGSAWDKIAKVQSGDNSGLVASIIKDKSDEIKNALKAKAELWDPGYSQHKTLTQEEIANAFDVPKAMLHTPPTAPKLDPKSLGFEPVQPQFTSTLAIDEPIGHKTTSKVVYWVQKPAGGFYKYPYTTAKAAWDLVNGDDISYHPLTKVVSCPKGQNPMTTKTKVVKKPKSTIKGGTSFAMTFDEAGPLMKESLTKDHQLMLWEKAESLGANTIVHHDNGHIEVTMKGGNTSYTGLPEQVFNAMKINSVHGDPVQGGGYKFESFTDWKKKKYAVSDDSPGYDIVSKHQAKQATAKAMMEDFQILTGKKVTPDMYADDIKCLTCGHTWGKHSGVMCPKGKGSFLFCSCPVTEPSPNCLIHGKGVPAKPVAVEEDCGDDDDDYNLDDEEPW